MTEIEAQEWLATEFGAPVVERLGRLAAAIVLENAQQNLISPSTVGTIWARHIVDSAQLVSLAPAEGRWMDIGSGAGLPGLVVAILRPAPILLVEPRRQRAEFLHSIVDLLGLNHAEVRQQKVEHQREVVDVISARAVATVEKLLQAAAACATPATRWLLPRGRSGLTELAALKRRWAGVFHMKQSTTDPDSAILILDGPARR